MLPSTRRDRQQQPLTLDADAVLPPGGHLAYFPPLAPASDLAPDGAEADHLPRGFPAAELREDGGGARRLWAGGELVFRDGWHTRLRMDGRAWTCEEEVRAREGKEGVVDVVRRYGLPGKWDVQETRSLAFIRHLPGQRTIKGEHPRERSEKGPPGRGRRRHNDMD